MFPNLSFKGHGGAVDFCRTLHHVKLFFNVASRHFAAVAHADEQAAALGVGERADRFGNFLGVVHTQLEVLMLVLPSSIMRRM